MKLFSTILKTFILLSTALIFSCENDQLLFKGPDFVRFTDEAITKKESFIQTTKIEVHLTQAVSDQDLVISYTTGGSAREGVDYKFISEKGKVVIKKGTYFGYIEIQLINNSNNILRSQNITFSLQTVNSSDIQVGQGKSAIGKTFTYTIEDDCILSGSYSATIGVFSVPTKNITITSNDCENYLLSNWNIGIDELLPYDYSLTFIDNGDNTLTIPEQDGIKGNGIVDPVTKKINMNVILIKFYTDGTDYTNSITYTPDQP